MNLRDMATSAHVTYFKACDYAAASARALIAGPLRWRGSQLSQRRCSLRFLNNSKVGIETVGIETWRDQIFRRWQSRILDFLRPYLVSAHECYPCICLSLCRTLYLLTNAIPAFAFPCDVPCICSRMLSLHLPFPVRRLWVFVESDHYSVLFNFPFFFLFIYLFRLGRKKQRRQKRVRIAAVCVARSFRCSAELYV